METQQIAQVLIALGCPASKALEMAEQLNRRAVQLSESHVRTHRESLEHLLRLMAGGWAAQQSAAAVETDPAAATISSASVFSSVSTLGDMPPPSLVAAPAVSAAESVQPWPTLATREVGNFRIFTLRSDIKSSPRTGHQHDFYVIESVDWVNVVALTRDREHLVMVEQFRHGSNTVELEVPGGMMDPHERDPLATGLRELREETGYEGQRPRVIGTVFPNAAIMNNRCHTVLVEDCELKHGVELDHGEDVATRLVPVKELPELVATGRVRHAIAVAALFHFDLWLRGVSGTRG